MSIVYLPMTSTTQATQAGAVSTAVGSIIASITSHPAWTQVNSVSGIGSSSYSYITLKNDHTISGLTQDFYVTFAYSGTNAFVFIHEGFQPTGVNTVQTLSVTGSPTGGSFSMNVAGNTITFGYNSTAAQVQTAITSALGAGTVSVTGGPGPGTPWVITFTGSFANSQVALMTLTTNALTGGTTPSASASMTTTGNNICTMLYTANTNFQSVTFDTLGRIPSSSYLGAHPSTGSPTGYGPNATNVNQTGYANFGTNTISLVNTTLFYNVVTYSDHFVFGLATTATAVHPYYYGAMTSVIPSAATNDPFVIGAYSLLPVATSSGLPCGTLTRVPSSQYSKATFWGGCGFYAGLANNFMWEYPPAYTNGTANATNQPDPTTNSYAVSRYMHPFVTSVASATNVSFVGWRAVFNNLVATSAAPSGITLGDTIALNGTYWMYCGSPSPGFFFYVDTGVAV